MSSLAAARADNFYHPPDWDPRRQSRAEASGAVGWKAHPLRERAKKLASEGVLVIRFEMPFNVRCAGCGNHIAKGVRFDAEKKTIGKYVRQSTMEIKGGAGLGVRTNDAPALLYVPSSHSRHSECPVADWYSPAKHALQLVMPVPFAT